MSYLPEIGVVVPTLNSGKTLEWTLLALKSQEGCRVNIVVVDSGSSDNTLEICARHKIHTEYAPPGNMYRAINTGMKLLYTEWITYLNSDDIAYRNAYSRLGETGRRKGADVIYGHSDYIDWNGRFVSSSKAAHPVLLRGLINAGMLQFAQPAAIFRKCTYENLRGFSEKYLSIADFDFFARAVLSGYKFERLPFPTITAFRLHSNQFSRKENKLAKSELAVFFRERKTNNLFYGTLSLSIWRLLNVSHYFLRMLRNRQFRSRLIDSKVTSV